MSTSRTTEAIIDFIRRRAAAGLAKYGQTMDRADLPPQAWLTHFKEELADGLQYCERVEEAMELLVVARSLIGELPEEWRPRVQPWLDSYDRAFGGGTVPKKRAALIDPMGGRHG